MNRHEIAAWLNDPELIALADRLHDAWSKFQPVAREVRTVTGQLQSARKRDAEAVAVAIERGSKIPEPTETALRVRLDTLVRQREALELLVRRAERDWEATLAGKVDELRAVVDERAADATDRLPTVLADLVEVLNGFNDCRRFAAWLVSIDRWRNPDITTAADRFPTAPADSQLTVTLSGGYQVDAPALAELVEASVAGILDNLHVDPRR